MKNPTKLESYQRLIYTRVLRLFWSLKEEPEEKIINAMNQILKDVGINEELKLKDLERLKR
jgi:hypothetical protein